MKAGDTESMLPLCLAEEVLRRGIEPGPGVRGRGQGRDGFGVLPGWVAPCTDANGTCRFWSTRKGRPPSPEYFKQATSIKQIPTASLLEFIFLRDIPSSQLSFARLYYRHFGETFLTPPTPKFP